MSRGLIQFVSTSGSLFGPELEVDLNVSKDILAELLSNVSGEETVPYSFSIISDDAVETEVRSTLLQALNPANLKAECAIQIRFHPLALFRVRSVTRCAGSMEGHTESVLCMAFSPDNALLATGSGDNTIRLWDVSTLTPFKVCVGHSGWILNVIWDPTGNKFASSSMDKSVKVWKTNGTLCGTLSGHVQAVTCIAWRPIHRGGDRIVSGSKDGAVKVWCSNSLRLLFNLSSHVAAVMQVKWGGEDEIFSGGRDRLVKIWNGQDGRFIEELKGHSHWINSLAINSEEVLRVGGDFIDFKSRCGGERFVTASDDFTMILWGERKIIFRLVGHQKIVNCVKFSPDGRYLASASFDKSVKLWSAVSGKFIASFRGHVESVYLVSWSPDSRLLVSCSKDSTVKVWNTETRKLKEDLPGHADEVFAVDWSSDGSVVASGGRDKIVKIWKH